MEISESDWAKIICSIIKSLVQKGVFSPQPENVIIERVGRNPIYPCGKSFGTLDLSQLEWSIENGHFWFSMPIKALHIIIDKGSIQGDLLVYANKMKVRI